ncbi:MAG: hypothetical protein OXH24_06960, partial [Cyanobacteria bacterium MAG IRC3_bin_20]|nr:hypothetical protein [Cyanobacteria bacterium MAG IRC3_bin_20]
MAITKWDAFSAGQKHLGRLRHLGGSEQGPTQDLLGVARPQPQKRREKRSVREWSAEVVALRCSLSP